MLPARSEEKTKEKIAPSPQMKVKTFFSKYDLRSLGLFTILMFIFSFYMFLPILNITISAFNFSDPSNFLKYFTYCFTDDRYREGLLNTLFTGLSTTFICCIIGLTVTIIFARYQFFGKRVFQIFAILPLVSPPFVGAFALGRLLDRNGIVSNFFQLLIPGLPDLLGSSLWGIIFMQSIHLWPLIFFNASASYSKIDPAQEEQARNLGSWGLNLYRQIIIPLITPGFVAGAVLVFIWSISDLGTPIVLDFSSYAPFIVFSDIRDEVQTHLNEAYALVIILLIISVLALLFASKIVGMKDYAPEKVSGMDLTRMMRKPSKPKLTLIYILLVILMGISLLPHIGIFFVAFVERIKLGEVIPTLWTLDGIKEVLGGLNVIEMIFEAIIYAIFAMVITIVIGIIVNYFFLAIRKNNPKDLNFKIIGLIGGSIGLVVGVTIVSYISANSSNILALIFNSLVYSILAMVITVLIGIIVSFLIVRKKNLKGISFIMMMIGGYAGLVIGAGVVSKISANSSEKVVAMFGFAIVLAAIFYLMGKTLNLRTLEIFSTIPFAVPGIVLASGYIAFFSSTRSLWGLMPEAFDLIPILGNITGFIRETLIFPNSPLEFRFTSYWFIFVIAYSVRRMPYVVQASTAVLRQIHESLEEAAHNLGASSAATLRQVTFPLMASGVLAGGVLTLITSFTEVSTSIMITPINQSFKPIFPFSPIADPLTKGIYDEINRGGAGSLVAGNMGLIQLLVAGIGMAITQKLLGEKTGTAFGGS